MRIFAHLIFDTKAKATVTPHPDPENTQVTITVEDVAGQRVVIEVPALEFLSIGNKKK
jgi:hypothetical protein